MSPAIFVSCASLLVARPAFAAADAGSSPPALPAPAGSETGARSTHRTIDLKLLDPVRAQGDPASAESQDVRLERLADGSGDLIYERPGFRALVKPDGSVVFEDKRVTLFLGPIELFSPRRLREGESGLQRALAGFPWRPIGPRPTSSLEDVVRGAMGRPRADARRGRAQPATEEYRSPFYVPASRYHADPGEACRRGDACFFDGRAIIIGISGIVDVTDELMRLNGQDPYRFEKAKFLAATSRLRSGLAARQRARNLAEAKRSLPDELEAIAKDDRFSPTQRRSIVEALRAEIDPAVPGAAELRAQIDTFLRERFSAAP